MLLLALDSSHSEGSLCLQRDSQILELLSWKQEKSHAELIASFLVKALHHHKLEPKDIDAYAVNVGPGSFTGIRISINTVKTLGFVTHKPIYAFNSLETIARGCSVDDETLIVAVNAHSELCYLGQFTNSNGSWQMTSDITVVSATKLDDLLGKKNTVFAGDAFTFYKDKIKSPVPRPKTFSDIPSAKYLNELALAHQNNANKIKSWETLEPLYVRLSAPEEKRLST